MSTQYLFLVNSSSDEHQTTLIPHWHDVYLYLDSTLGAVSRRKRSGGSNESSPLLHEAAIGWAVPNWHSHLSLGVPSTRHFELALTSTKQAKEKRGSSPVETRFHFKPQEREGKLNFTAALKASITAHCQVPHEAKEAAVFHAGVRNRRLLEAGRNLIGSAFFSLEGGLPGGKGAG